MILLHGGLICPAEIAWVIAAIPWILGTLPFWGASFKRLRNNLKRG